MHDGDMAGLYVGPQPPRDFLDAHMVKPPVSAPPLPNKGKIRYRGDAKVNELTLITAFKPFCPNMDIEDTHTIQGKGENTGFAGKADMTAFQKGNNPLRHPSSSSRQRKSTTGQRNQTSTKLPSDKPPPATDPALEKRRASELFMKSQFFAELKLKDDSDKPRCEDAFTAPAHDEHRKERDPVGKGRGASEVRGQLFSYAMLMFENSHRVFVFSVLIMEEEARLMRWDRSGVIFSERFNWQTTSYLAEFLWRFNFMTPAQRGFDTTVSLPSVQEAKLAHSVFKAKREAGSHHALPEETEVLRRFEVWDKEDCHIVITGRPQAYPRTLPGRSTFGYIGVDITDPKAPKLVFLKDSWRISLPGMPIEGEIYERLNDAEVPHLPDYLYGGDVPLNSPSPSKKKSPSKSKKKSTPTETSTRKAQTTETQNHAKAEWAYMTHDVYPLTHHRTVFGKIGRPLNKFKSTQELCRVLSHVVFCHWKAYIDADTLHRDISASNIMIDDAGNGMLIDWDLCCFPNDELGARRGWRTGTVQFMSVSILMNPFGRDHLLRDDLESIVHILFHHVLKYRPTICAKEENFASNFYHVFDNAIGGEGRKAMLMGNYFGTDKLEASSTLPRPLVALMHQLRELFKPLYLRVSDIKNAGGKDRSAFENAWGKELVEKTKRENAFLAAPTVSEAQVTADRESRMQLLENSVVLAVLFDDALQEHGWFPNDGAENQISKEAAKAVADNQTSTTVTKYFSEALSRKRCDLVDGEEHRPESDPKRVRLNNGSAGTPSSSRAQTGSDTASNSKRSGRGTASQPRAGPANGTRSRSTGSTKSESAGSTKSSSRRKR